MAAHQWTANHVTVGPQLAQMTYQPSVDFGHAGPSYNCPRTGRRGRCKHWIGTYHFDCGFVLEESVREIRAEAANDGAEAASPGNRTRHAGLRRNWFQLPEHRDDWWWVVGLKVRPRNKSAVLTMGTFIIPEAKESTCRSAATSRICWPFFSTPVGWCITNTHHNAKPSPNSTSRGYFVAFVLLCSANDRTCVQQNLGSAITTMHLPILRIWFKVFLAKHNIPWFVRLPTLPTYLLVIFGCSPNWKCRWKGPDLSQEKTLCGTRRPSCTRFQKKLSSNGRTAGRIVCITKGTTLKGIRVWDVKINNCIFADQRSDTFCTAHLYYNLH